MLKQFIQFTTNYTNHYSQSERVVFVRVHFIRGGSTETSPAFKPPKWMSTGMWTHSCYNSLVQWLQQTAKYSLPSFRDYLAINWVMRDARFSWTWTTGKCLSFHSIPSFYFRQRCPYKEYKNWTRGQKISTEKIDRSTENTKHTVKQSESIRNRYSAL